MPTVLNNEDSINLEIDTKTYDIFLSKIIFTGFSDTQQNIDTIVPIGNFLDEIILYKDGYLHIAKVSDRQFIMNNNNKINVIKTLPWTELGEIFSNGIISSAKYKNIKYIPNNNIIILSFRLAL
jgi:hypothetical protein